MHEFHKKNLYFVKMYYTIQRKCRGVAQPGRVLAWGARGRRFESCHPDHRKTI